MQLPPKDRFVDNATDSFASFSNCSSLVGCEVMPGPGCTRDSHGLVGTQACMHDATTCMVSLSDHSLPAEEPATRTHSPPCWSLRLWPVAQPSQCHSWWTTTCTPGPIAEPHHAALHPGCQLLRRGAPSTHADSCSSFGSCTAYASEEAKEEVLSSV